MVKHILNTSNEDFDFVLIGITSPENQYFLAGKIDDTLGISLFLSDYIPFSLKDGRLFKFSLFRFVDSELSLEYFFIPNTSNFEEPHVNSAVKDDLFAGFEVDESVKLIKELPKTDYFLILKGENLHTFQYKIIDAIKSIPEIVQIQSIEPNDLASKRNLIF